MAPDARAEPAAPTAEELFDRARSEMRQGNYAAARDRFTESLRLEATVGTLFNLSLCEEKMGALADSLDHLESARAMAGPDDRRLGPMDELIKALEARVPHLTIKLVAEASTDVAITLDGRPLDLAMLDHPQRANPGDHVIVVRGAEGPSETTLVHLNEHDNTEKIVAWHRPQETAAVESPAAPSPPSPSSQVSSAPDASRWVGAGTLTAGGLGVLAGGVLGFMTLGRKVVVDHHCNGVVCDAEGSQASSEGKSLGTASTIATGAGLLSLAVGSYLVLRGGTVVAPSSDMTTRNIGYVAASMGGAALVASAVAAAVTLSAQRELANRCSSGACGDQQALDAAARGRTASSLGTIAFGVGVAGVGVASYSLLFHPLLNGKIESRLTFAPSEIAFSARF